MTGEFIGIYERIDNFGRVVPDGRRDIREILIPQGSDGGAAQGDRVVVQLTRPGAETGANADAGSGGGPGRRVNEGSGKRKIASALAGAGPRHSRSREDALFGKVIEVLGPGDDLAVAEKALIRRLELRQSFTHNQLAAAKELHRPLQAADREGRLDLSQDFLVTIDGDDTRDIDDAVGLRRDGDIWRLGVHIADVSHYVSEGSSLDKEAMARGTSVYFPDMVLPMLPPDLSNGICSLNAGVDRLAVSCLMDMDGSGTVIRYEIRPTVIRVAERLSYTQVQAYLDRHHWGTRDALEGRGSTASQSIEGRGGATTQGNDEFRDGTETRNQGNLDEPQAGPILVEMAALCMALRRKRLERGALDFSLPECGIAPGSDANTVELHKKDRLLSEMIIEELMIAANETVAAHFRQIELPLPYRVHDKPSGDKAFVLPDLLKSFGFTLDKALPPHRAYQRLLDEAKGTPQESVVSTLLLRSMEHAHYSVKNAGHFGLASDCYCHFTSPIRRYPDLMVHRMIKYSLAANQDAPDHERKEALRAKMEEQCREASELERAAEDAERKVDSLWKAFYMRQFIGEEFDGVINGVTEFALFVALENTVEGMLHVSRLDGYFTFAEESMALICEKNGRRYRMGDAIRVVLEKVDVGAGFIDFRLPD